MQRAKLKWLKLGDGNNAYFHATVKGKNKQDGIYNLEDPNGNILTEQGQIEKEVLRFYKSLICTKASSTRHVDINAIRNGPQLQEASRNMLIQTIYNEENWEALKNIGDTKAPGLDGLNAKFYKVA